MKTEDIAKICHQANKAYCETIGDQSQKDWHNASDWQKESAIKGVEYRTSQNPRPSPEEMHNCWLKQKQEDGWLYGKYKDEQKKTHPCYKPYSELPEEQKKKDILFSAIVDALTE